MKAIILAKVSRKYDQEINKVKEYQRQIDRMVYKLYGLTEEEIKIVENS